MLLGAPEEPVEELRDERERSELLHHWPEVITKVSDRSADGESCQGRDQVPVASGWSPLNLDEVRHQQRCQSPYCASQDHGPYRERQQQRDVPAPELGHPDWHVVWGWSHIIGPRRPRVWIGWH